MSQGLPSSIFSINTLAPRDPCSVCISGSYSSTKALVTKPFTFPLATLPDTLTQLQKPWCSLRLLRGYYSSRVNHDSCQNCVPSHGQWWQQHRWHYQSGPVQGQRSTSAFYLCLSCAPLSQWGKRHFSLLHVENIYWRYSCFWAGELEAFKGNIFFMGFGGYLSYVFTAGKKHYIKY